jgi:putative NADH-flavin reductase
MKILILGATGRVGNAAVLKALDKRHQIIAFVRKKNKLTINNPNLSVVEGDIYDKDALDKLKQVEFDIVINVIGADPLKPSTIFSDATALILQLLSQNQGKRYLAITGIAQMEKTFFGEIVIGILKLTPVKNAIADHQNAFEQISKSTVDWTLVGCPYINDGPEKGVFKKDTKFRGGFKTIHPGDVASAIVEEIDKADFHQIIGIWY